VLSELIEHAQRKTEDGDTIEEEIDRDRWCDAKAIEVDRILTPSLEWREAFEVWWSALGSNPDSKS
jgi:hypothetical protein